MDLQIVLPDESPAMNPQRIIDLGVTAEQLDYHAAWLPDHLLPPAAYGTTYGGVFEPLVTLTYLAARTSRIRFGTSVLVLPIRSPFAVAKQAATLHALSGGRLTLGVGIGWDRDEFAAVGSDFTSRAARADEAIALMRHLFTGHGEFRGDYYAFKSGVFEPRPRHELPIMVGGTSGRALRRAAALADEWQGVGLNPAEFADAVRRIRDQANHEVRVGTRIACTGGHVAFTQALDEARRFRDAGADALAVWFGTDDGLEERMTAFAERLMA